MSLQETLTNIDNYGTTYHKNWPRFIYDHYTLIKEKSKLVTISLDDMFRYEHRPEDFIELHGEDSSITWIMLTINQIPSRREFFGITSILIPPTAYIEQLRDAFDSIQANQEEVVDLTV